MNTFLPQTKKPNYYSYQNSLPSSFEITWWKFLLPFAFVCQSSNLRHLDLLSSEQTFAFRAEHHVMATFYSDAFQAGIAVREKWTIVCSSRNKMYFFSSFIIHFLTNNETAICLKHGIALFYSQLNKQTIINLQPLHNKTPVINIIKLVWLTMTIVVSLIQTRCLRWINTSLNQCTWWINTTLSFDKSKIFFFFFFSLLGIC